MIVQTITAATTTSTGLTVTAELDDGIYPKGIKIPDDDMQGQGRRLSPGVLTGTTSTTMGFHTELNPKRRKLTNYRTRLIDHGLCLVGDFVTFAGEPGQQCECILGGDAWNWYTANPFQYAFLKLIDGVLPILCGDSL